MSNESEVVSKPFLPQIPVPTTQPRSIISRWKNRWFGILSVASVTLLAVLGLSSTSSSPWHGGPNGELAANAGTHLKSVNSSDDFDTLAEQMAADWPRGSTVRIYNSQAVASDVTSCSTVGNDILNANGSAADSVIASALCMGVVHPYSSGIGGGVFVIYYDRASKTVFTINGREEAPSAATTDMFLKNDSNGQPISPLFGWQSVAIPGELAGMWALHQRFGRLPWKDLFQPAIRLARNGVVVTNFFGRILAFNKRYLLGQFGDENMREMLIDNKTGSTFVEGDVIRMPVLANTLETISNDPLGVKEFYNGSIAENMIKDIHHGGGILQLQDLQQYQVRLETPIATQLKNNLTLYGLVPPCGSVILNYVLQILEGYGYDTAWDEMLVEDKNLFYHRVIEAMKFGFAERTKLADPQFVPAVNRIVKNLLNKRTAELTRLKIDDNRTYDDPAHYGSQAEIINEGGTAHVSVLDKEGNAAAYSTSINNIFGSYRISTSTGIMLNNHMDDFTTDAEKANLFGVPPSKVNMITPGKRPQSSKTPVLVVDGHGEAVIVAGGTGGTRILTGLVNILTRILFFKQDLKSALDAPRLHHQLYPAEAEYEKRFEEVAVTALRSKGHKMVRSEAPQKYPYSAVEVIYSNKTDGQIYAVSDGRKGGLPDGV